jgi:mannose-6-phosphate isomerase
LEKGELMSALKVQKVKVGETYFIPSGMLHAIGAGILIAEIQQNCDLTYRVYDYERRGADGSLRELHVDKALDVTVPFTEDEVNVIRYEGGKPTEQTLAHCRYFKTDKLNVTAPTTLTVDERSFAFLLCLEGEGSVTAGGITCPVGRADGYYLPAGLGEVTLDGNMTVLIARMG